MHRLIKITDRTLDVVFSRFGWNFFTITLRQKPRGVSRSRRRTGSFCLEILRCAKLLLASASGSLWTSFNQILKRQHLVFFLIFSSPKFKNWPISFILWKSVIKNQQPQKSDFNWDRKFCMDILKFERLISISNVCTFRFEDQCLIP